MCTHPTHILQQMRERERLMRWAFGIGLLPELIPLAAYTPSECTYLGPCVRVRGRQAKLMDPLSPFPRAHLAAAIKTSSSTFMAACIRDDWKPTSVGYEMSGRSPTNWIPSPGHRRIVPTAKFIARRRLPPDPPTLADGCRHRLY